MRLVIQRVSKAECKVEDHITGSIDVGYMVLVGLGVNDDEKIVGKMAEKLSKLRIFSDENDKINLSIHDVKGKILSISQFTLYADCTHGNRPGFTNAAAPDKASALYEYILEKCR